MVVEKRIVLTIIECHLWRQNINFKVFKKNLFIFWLHWVLVAVHEPSLVALNEGYSLIVVPKLLIEVVSLFVQHGL